MDKRYQGWLSAKWLIVITTERDDILNQLLEMRKAGASKETCRKSILRVLHLNKLLNYNGNPGTNNHYIR